MDVLAKSKEIRRCLQMGEISAPKEGLKHVFSSPFEMQFDLLNTDTAFVLFKCVILTKMGVYFVIIWVNQNFTLPFGGF